MSNFIAQCPHCKQQFYAQSEWIGQNTNCLSCGKTFTIQIQPKPNSSLKTKRYAIWILVILLISCCGGVIQVVCDEVRLYQYKQYLKSIDFNPPPAMDFKYVCLDIIKSYATGCTILGILTTGPFLSHSEAVQRISDKYLYRTGNPSIFRAIIHARESIANLKALM